MRRRPTNQSLQTLASWSHPPLILAFDGCVLRFKIRGPIHWQSACLSSSTRSLTESIYLCVWWTLSASDPPRHHTTQRFRVHRDAPVHGGPCASPSRMPWIGGASATQRFSHRLLSNLDKPPTGRSCHVTGLCPSVSLATAGQKPIFSRPRFTIFWSFDFFSSRPVSGSRIKLDRLPFSNFTPLNAVDSHVLSSHLRLPPSERHSVPTTLAELDGFVPTLTARFTTLFDQVSGRPPFAACFRYRIGFEFRVSINSSFRFGWRSTFVCMVSDFASSNA